MYSKIILVGNYSVSGDYSDRYIAGIFRSTFIKRGEIGLNKEKTITFSQAKNAMMANKGR